MRRENDNMSMAEKLILKDQIERKNAESIRKYLEGAH